MLPETGEFRKAKFNGAVSAPKPTPVEVHGCGCADRSNPSHPGCCPREIHGICPANCTLVPSAGGELAENVTFQETRRSRPVGAKGIVAEVCVNDGRLAALTA